RGVPEVGKLSKMLGDLMRQGMKGKDMIPLYDEIQNIEKYMMIQKYRYGEKFDLRIKVDQEAMALVVPKFILQPIVENAIVHGLEIKKGGGSIQIIGEINNAYLHMKVVD